MTRLAEDGCLLAPESADEIRLSTTDPATTIDQNESPLAAMGSMNKTHLATTLSAESRPTAECRVWVPT
jgi:hypothetical protein